MAKPQLHELIEWLRHNGHNRFEIYDVDQNRTLHKCASYEDLVSGGTTPEEYFTRLVDRGVKTVQLQKKRKNGSTYIREGCGLNFALSTDPNNNVAASGRVDNPAATLQQPNQAHNSPFMGLMGAGTGLGFPEIMAMRSQSDRYEETKSHNRELLTKVERLEAENKRLETECLTHKLGAESKPSALDKLVEGLASNPVALSDIIKSIKGSGTTVPGLNAAPGPILSDLKNQLIEVISNPDLPETYVAAAWNTLIQYANSNTSFINAHTQLLTQHNSNNGSDSDYNSEV